MFNRSKKGLVVLSISLLALGLIACAPYNAFAAPTLDGQGGPHGQGGNGQDGDMTNGGNSQAGEMGNGGNGQATGLGQGSSRNSGGKGAGLTPLSEVEVEALKEAILEEYGALNLYQAVIDQFGNIRPFTQILKSEQQHVNALLRQADKYGVEAPANPGLASPITFTTVDEACQAGVDAEKADAALYDELKPVVTHSDLLSVFTRLQNASLNSHLPAFEACH
ncbi:MAG: hypothetical protein JW908_09660 [Anaerolineales bacterium]|nr:hypothetical protein [Anaerolineales bacterium]